MARNRRGEIRTCIYCGVPIARGRTCHAHRELEALDPLEAPARERVSEAELGVVDQHAVADNIGRDELF